MKVQREGAVTTKVDDSGTSVLTHASVEAAEEYVASCTPAASPKAAPAPAKKAPKAVVAKKAPPKPAAKKKAKRK